MKIRIKDVEFIQEELKQKPDFLHQPLLARLEPLQVLIDICSKVEASVNVNFANVEDIDIKLLTDLDDGWYVPQKSIVIVLPRFNDLTSNDARLLTIAHEVAHHIIACDFNLYFKEKYSNEVQQEKIRLFKYYEEESFADFLVKDELCFEIDTLRDQERINSIKQIKISLTETAL